MNRESRDLISIGGDILHDVGSPSHTIEITQSAADHVAAWTTDQRLAALHEAGHVVLGTVLGFAVKEVDIKGRSAARTEFADGDDTVPTILPASRSLDRIVVDLGGLAAEIVILGQGAVGGDADLTSATRRGLSRIANGLDPRAPFVSFEAFQRFDAFPLPADLADAMAAAVVETLAECRARSLVLAAEHRESILAFARMLVEERRLSDRALEDALAGIGLAPVDPGR